MDDDPTDVKQNAGEDASISEPSTEKPKAAGEVEVPDAENASTEAPPEEGAETETEETPKKGANARIRELNAQRKQAEERAKSLEERLAEMTGQGAPQMPLPPYQPQIEPGQEYTAEQYKQDVLQTAQGIVDLQIKQNNAINRINNEAQQVMQAYPTLNPDSDDFDQEISDTVTEATEAYVKANPYSASVKKFVDKLMKPYQRAVTKEVGKATEKIARQVSQAATKPTSVTTKGSKPDTEKSIKELEEELGFFN